MIYKLEEMTILKIQLYADFTCPFSYMGKRRLDEVMEASEEPIEFEWRAFQLTPEASKEKAMPTVELLAKKFNKTYEETLATTKRLRDQAANEFGLTYNYETMLAPNTLNAHRLTYWAATQGKSHEVAEGYFAAIFTHGKDLNREEDVLEVIANAGLDVEEAKAILRSDAYEADVQADRSQAIQNGIRSVPSYVINDEALITGVQPVSTFVQAINE